MKTLKPSTSAVACSSLDSVNESETVQKADADELEQDAEDAKNQMIALENENTLLQEKLTAVEKKN